jgi:alkylmercury lyase
MTTDQAVDEVPQQAAAPTGALGTTDAVLDAASRLLLRHGRSITVAELAADVGRDGDDVEATIREHEARGRIIREDGVIVAAAGISVVPSAYALRAGNRELWAWCATTSLGVLAALGTGGEIVSRDPVTGAELRTTFVGSEPLPSPYTAFWPSEEFKSSCQSAAGEYCDTLNLFADESAARAWAERAGVPGDVMPVDAAARRARLRWDGSLDVAGAGATMLEALAGPAPGDTPADTPTDTGADTDDAVR